jgi:hypothetical protein
MIPATGMARHITIQRTEEMMKDAKPIEIGKQSEIKRFCVLNAEFSQVLNLSWRLSPEMTFQKIQIKFS